jgi:hypothetical protein
MSHSPNAFLFDEGESRYSGPGFVLCTGLHPSNGFPQSGSYKRVATFLHDAELYHNKHSFLETIRGP